MNLTYSILAVIGILYFPVIRLNAQDSLFSSPIYYPAGIEPWSICSQDFNGDGIPDLAVANLAGQVSILNNYGDGSFAPLVSFNSNPTPYSISTEDYDGDLDYDLIVANVYANRISILLNNGFGSFDSVLSDSIGSFPVSALMADLDSDNDMDVAATIHPPQAVSLLFNNGDGVLDGPITYETGGDHPWGLSAADFNGDSLLDLATANYGSANISILFNNGGGVYPEPITIPVGLAPWSIIASDLEADGDNDIVVSVAGLDQILTLINMGYGSFQIGESLSVGDQPLSISVGDINGDTLIDIVSANHASNSISVLINTNGDSSWQRLDFPIFDGPASICLADLDNDGDNDIAVANEFSNNVGILFNRRFNETRHFRLIEPDDGEIVTDILIQLIWSTVAGVDSLYPVSFKAFWSADSNFIISDSSSVLPETTFALQQELEQSRSYYWRVRAFLEDSWTIYSTRKFSFYLDGQPLGALIISPENGINANSETYLSWLISADPDSFDAVSYTIQIDNDTAFAFPEINQSGLQSGSIVDDAFAIRLGELEGHENLQMDTRYFWRVRADDNYGLHSDWTDGSNWFVFMAQNHAPSAPDSGFTPSGGEEIISLTPTIAWFAASDPDPDDHPGTLSYSIELDTDTTFAGFVYRDTTGLGENLITISDPLLDNAHYFYRLKTLDDGGLSSGWSAIQNFWTNHYNFPPEPFPLFAPNNGQKQVVYYTHFSWGNTVDYDPMSNFAFTLQYSIDSLFLNYVRSIPGLNDTAISLMTDSIAITGPNLFWRVLAIDDDSLSRTGGLPEGPRSLLIIPPGDANTNGVTNGIDATFMVAYLKGQGAAPDPIQAGDANGNCTTNGIDVVYLVAYLKGIGAPPVRPDCGQFQKNSPMKGIIYENGDRSNIYKKR